jgi:uncharacterized protein YndB with AHSA1/START domain
VTTIRVSTTIEASPEAVWSAVEDVGTHTRWMEDAVAIRFMTAQTSGVGTEFECDTRVGPLRTVDRMTITAWEPPRVLGVRHVGMVTGSGRFLVEPAGAGTRFTWEEELRLPGWMGGRAGGVVAAPLLRAVWRRSLRNLKSLVEGVSGV